MATITMRELLEAGIHFGHQTRRWNPKMARYIYGERHGIYIIDLQHTLRQLQRAYSTVRKSVANGGTVLFVGTKKQARESVQREADRCGQYYINNRWLGGTLTNWQTLQKSIRKLHNFEELEKSGRIEKFTKKEGIEMRKERDRLEKNLAGIKAMESVPSIMFVIDSNREAIAVSEARRLGITCVAVVDTNSDPDAVPVPIPGNDDAIRAINLFCSLIADAVIEGKMEYEKKRKDDEAQQRAQAASPQNPSKDSQVARLKSKHAGDAADEVAASEPAAAEEAAVATGDAEASDTPSA